MKRKNEITGLRTCKWFDRKTHEILYGIDAKVNNKWYHLKDGDDWLMFDTEPEAMGKIRQIWEDEVAP